jgi:2',3'-cyclic-nucleotide 2'-phosphodiesterase/3'-nucleotidase
MAEKTFDIYYTSDLHAFIYPTDYRSTVRKDIGLFKCANKFRKDGNTLIIDGGDILQGSPFGAFCHDSFKDAGILADVMNLCAYDYVTLGNHDFNYGIDYLNSYLSVLDARCVCENIIKNGKPRFPSRIHTLENGLKIGIVGIVTDHVNIWEKPENINGITITSPFEAAKEALEKIKDQVDISLCIYHGGFERDLATGKLLSTSSENIGYKICEELEFDILLTGHQHMSVTGQEVHGTFVVQPIDSGRECIHVHTSVDDRGKHITAQTLPASGECNTEMMLEFYDVEYGAQDWLDVIVGYMSEPLKPLDPLTMATKGSVLADFFNEVQLSSTGAQISASSLANEVAGLPRIVHRRDVLTAYPYTNTVTVLKISGSILRQALERSAEYFDKALDGSICIAQSFLKPKVEHYNYDYYDGIEYEFDVSRPIGQRVTKLLYQNKPVLPEDEFTISLNSYRASGAGGYDFYQSCPVVSENNTDMTELILEYFSSHPQIDVHPKENYKVI